MVDVYNVNRVDIVVNYVQNNSNDGAKVGHRIYVPVGDTTVRANGLHLNLSSTVRLVNAEN